MYSKPSKMVLNQAAIILFCLFAFSSTLALAGPIKYKECREGAESTLKSVDMEPSEQDPQGRYIFHKGTNVTATVVFTPKEMVTAGTLELFVILAGQKLRMKVPNPNACEKHNVKCPLKPEVEYNMVGTIEVQKNLPRLPFLVQLDVLLPERKYLFCFQFLVHILD